MALRKMGSSVWHGGFSTFIAIVILAPSKTYVFIVFFRLWFCIVLFGMANGFLLLPVALSIIGPTYTATNFSHDTKPLSNNVKPDSSTLSDRRPTPWPGKEVKSGETVELDNGSNGGNIIINGSINDENESNNSR